MLQEKIAIFWFRRDLRLHDNHGLYKALMSGYPVLLVFIFDREILDKLEDADDGRVTFIHQVISKLQEELQKAGGTLLVYYGKPLEIWQQLLEKYSVATVYTNHDYEPYATERDNALHNLLQSKKIKFNTYKDQVIFENKEVVNGQGNPYSIFTPYSKKWLAAFHAMQTPYYPSEAHLSVLLNTKAESLPSLQEMGFEKSSLVFPPKEIREQMVEQYARERDFPARQQTTRIGIHLRFGTVSIREMVKKASKLSDVWLKELIWREFYMMLLANFPHVVNAACKPAFDRIQWRNNEQEFEKWCKGETGYPIVDAGMRQLNQTGFMHNRVRMLTAAFLVKHLLIDWRWGDAYFARKLLDYELASNNGSWQWIAGSGCDAAPYFRVFNPNAQAKKFDKANEYIKKWVPEYGTEAYAEPIIAHEKARDRALKVYREAVKQPLNA